MGKRTIVDKLAGLKPCGCTNQELCEQHIQALPYPERLAYLRRRRGARGTGRGRGAA